MIVSAPSFAQLILASVLIRVVLIFYSEWHDAHSVVKYTDVDYRVFTDAAKYILRQKFNFVIEPETENVAQGPIGHWFPIGDPYKRETYRYTPLLALILTPNIWLLPSFGKFIFAACDILVGVLIRRLLLSQVLVKPHGQAAPKDEARNKADLEKAATLYTSLYLLNPLVFSISTRGSSESTLGALVVGTLYYALNERWDAAAILLGLSTHWKIYPVIYVASIVGLVSSNNPASGQNLLSWLERLVNRRTIRFAFISGVTFLLLSGAMYLIWGYPFLYETYLYHLYRRDHRHNFSPHFYPIYLTYPPYGSTNANDNISLFRKLLRSPLTSFVPQMTLALGTGLLFGDRKESLPFTWFIQTALFVTFNKVCTSQYFLWYLTLLPLVLPSLSISLMRGGVLIAVWIGTQAMWLRTAYELEFLGKNVYHDLWVRSIVFMLANCWIISEIMDGFAKKQRQRVKR
ncbi:hypothetical protein BD410DRAFT_785563 [Rickenella mellea]|uniref:GPI mannosyltransferase 1 n=1 Tax=Rickenella mellea TaxID=50990 RepID=A0A4Y7QB76_9AGAM|nr:hypothetical protein BD410DRAFT_785563 [Rickenella mellea]